MLSLEFFTSYRFLYSKKIEKNNFSVWVNKAQSFLYRQLGCLASSLVFWSKIKAVATQLSAWDPLQFSLKKTPNSFFISCGKTAKK